MRAHVFAQMIGYHQDGECLTHRGYEASIEIVGRDFGDQEETAWLPFSGISYDSHHHQILKRASTNSRKRGLTSG